MCDWMYVICTTRRDEMYVVIKTKAIVDRQLFSNDQNVTV